MSPFELLFLAIGLSMDAFAVAICKASTSKTYLSSLTNLETVWSTTSPNKNVIFRNCVDVTHFKRIVANVTVTLLKKGYLRFFLSTTMNASTQSIYVQHGSDTTTNMTITIPNRYNEKMVHWVFPIY